MVILTAIPAFSANRVYRYNGKYIVVPDQKKEIEGIGVTFMGSLNFETVKDDQGQDVKKGWMWIRGCGKTFINDDKILNERQGSRIKVRFDRAGSCEVKGWEKF